MNRKEQTALKKFLSIRGMGAALTAFAGLIIIYIVFGIINPSVFSGQNIINLLRSMSKYLLVGVAQSYVMITGNVDLSIGSVVAVSAMISATLMTKGMTPVLACLIALVCCLALGVISGVLVGKFKLPPFIATLGTMFVGRGISYMVNGNRNTDALATGIGKEAADRFSNIFYYGKTFGVYNTFWLALIVFLIFFFIMSKTFTGRHIYAVGSNVDAARLSGVDVVKTTIKVYVVSSVCCWIVGLILCAQAGMGNMEAGNMYEMYGVASGVIGGISPSWRRWYPFGDICRCGIMADAGKWTEYDWCTGWYAANCNWRYCCWCSSSF